MIPFKTFNVTLGYKSGAMQTIRYLSQFDFERDRGTTVKWNCLGRDKIMLLDPAGIESIVYTVNPFIKNLYCLILRLTGGLL